jgi:hypothetical protein
MAAHGFSLSQKETLGEKCADWITWRYSGTVRNLSCCFTGICIKATRLLKFHHYKITVVRELNTQNNSLL